MQVCFFWESRDARRLRAQTIGEHLKYAMAIRRMFAFAAPLLQGSPGEEAAIASLYLLRSGSATEALELVKGDPYCVAGVWDQMDIYEMTDFHGAWGETAAAPLIAEHTAGMTHIAARFGTGRASARVAGESSGGALFAGGLRCQASLGLRNRPLWEWLSLSGDAPCAALPNAPSCKTFAIPLTVSNWDDLHV